ncbi:hypothetical protein J1N35_014196 [Gossypium stocksii]|uniref:Uncharacterized protein n=1 Tax=Gossypium stocksii TaxID=47602 RepID=A0A9D3VUA4_9ROSI|nr:hypothetical protein J1N35_014196 [Gossypium stocksii]
MNTQDEAAIKKWQNEMDELRRDVRALHSESQEMDWLFCSNNPLALEIVAISFQRDFKPGEEPRHLAQATPNEEHREKVTLGDREHTTIEYVQFYIVDHPMAYNIIFGRTMQRMVVATFCMKIKFLTKTRVDFLQSNQRTARQCHMLSVKQAREPVVEGLNLQKVELESQALDLDSLDVMDEHRSKKIEAIKHTETLKLFHDNEENCQNVFGISKGRKK